MSSQSSLGWPTDGWSGAYVSGRLIDTGVPSGSCERSYSTNAIMIA